MFVAVAAPLVVSAPVASVAPVASAKGVGRWTHEGFDAARTGSNRAERAIGPGTVGGLRELWVRRIGGGWWSPVVRDGVLYVGGARGTYALASDTGDVLWEGPPSGGVAAVGSRIFVHSADPAGLAVLSSATGEELWSQPSLDAPSTYGEVGSPAVSRGVVVVTAGTTAGVRGGTVAVRSSTGEELWRAPSASEGPAAVMDGAAYVGTPGRRANAGGVVRSYDLETGSLLWQVRRVGSWPAGPVVDRQTVYVATYPVESPFEVFALGAADGEPLWQASFARSPTVPVGMALAHGTLFVSWVDYEGCWGGVAAFAAGAGGLVWQRITHGRPTAPSVANGLVHVGMTVIPSDCWMDVSHEAEHRHGRVRTFDAATGERLWRWHLAGPVCAARPVVVDGRLFVVTCAAFSPDEPNVAPRARVVAFGLSGA